MTAIEIQGTTVQLYGAELPLTDYLTSWIRDLYQTAFTNVLDC